jgi:hypothetical protein
MPNYRIYTILGTNCIGGPPVEAHFETDEQAIKKAGELLPEKELEVWQGTRLVSRIKPTKLRRGIFRRRSKPIP